MIKFQPKHRENSEHVLVELVFVKKCKDYFTLYPFDESYYIDYTTDFSCVEECIEL